MGNNLQKIIKENIQEHLQLFLELSETDYLEKIEEATECILHAIKNGRKILIAGNGGSAADAQHMAAELVVRFEKERQGLPAIALTTDTSILSAGGNDYGFERVYERQVQALGVEGDVLVAISTSGKSENILRAMKLAREKQMKIIGMTGKNALCMHEICDVCLRVPHERTARIQEVHGHTIHILCSLVEQSI